MSKDKNTLKEEALIETTTNSLVEQTAVPLGFENEDAEDMIIPRIKVLQMLSPEVKDRVGEYGDIIDSLTKVKVNEKRFIPVMSFKNVIIWKDRSEGGGMEAIARDNKILVPLDGSPSYPVGKLADFDNTKTGKDALPKATRYFNFLGFFEGERMPVILSFGKTNYSEGKKLYSLAKVTMQNMWNYAYKLTSKLMAKNGNEWYIIVPISDGPTTEEDRAFGLNLYKTFSATIQTVNYDFEDNQSDSAAAPAPDVESTEY